jgi:F-type H+-transporting ATPase subunit b
MAAQVTNDTLAATTSQTETAPSESGLAALGVDGGVLIVQTVNFFLVLLILSWVLYRPLLKFLTERRKLIAEGLAAAVEQKRQAAAAETKRLELIARARQEAATLLSAARAEAQAERVAVKMALAKERDQLLAVMDRRLSQEQAKLEANLRTHLANLVVQALARISTQNPSRSAELKTAITKTVEELK